MWWSTKFNGLLVWTTVIYHRFSMVISRHWWLGGDQAYEVLIRTSWPTVLRASTIGLPLIYPENLSPMMLWYSLCQCLFARCPWDNSAWAPTPRGQHFCAGTAVEGYSPGLFSLLVRHGSSARGRLVKDSCIRFTTRNRCDSSLDLSLCRPSLTILNHYSSEKALTANNHYFANCPGILRWSERWTHTIRKRAVLHCTSDPGTRLHWELWLLANSLCQLFPKMTTKCLVCRGVGVYIWHWANSPYVGI